jgi:hypothetical protein
LLLWLSEADVFKCHNFINTLTLAAIDMTGITKEIADELVLAMDAYQTIAKQLIDKLVFETDQPEKLKIEKGSYYEIQNAALLNGTECLSDNWQFDVHGEHCRFKNIITGQTLEVSLSDKNSIGNLDPYFFHQFLETTEGLKHLTKYFTHPFTGTLNFFKQLEKQGVLTHLYGVEFRKKNVANKQLE